MIDIPIFALYGSRETRFAVVSFSDESFGYDHFIGKSEADNWRPRKVIITSGKSYPLKDHVFGHLNAPFVSECFRQTMMPVCGKCAEFLPLKGPKTKPYYVFNVIKVIDCLDVGRSTFGVCPKYFFNPRRCVAAPVFKVPQKSSVIFVTEPFIAAARQHKLTGIDFEYPHLMRLVRTETVVPGFPS